MKNLSVSHQLVVTDEDGRLVSDTGRRESHSFVKQFSQVVFNSVPFWLSSGSPVAMTSTDGSTVSYVVATGSVGNMFLRVDAATGTSTSGIQAGTGTGAESINDTALGTQIAHGTGAGQLQYGTVTFAAPTTTATTTTFRVTRVFTNGSGGTVTVQEIGLVTGAAWIISGTPSKKMLLIRDLTGATAVNNGQQLTVNYDLTTTI